MVSPPSAFSTTPILEFLKGSSSDDFLSWVSSSFASQQISRSILGGYLHRLFTLFRRQSFINRKQISYVQPHLPPQFSSFTIIYNFTSPLCSQVFSSYFLNNPQIFFWTLLIFFTPSPGPRMFTQGPNEFSHYDTLSVLVI